MPSEDAKKQEDPNSNLPEANIAISAVFHSEHHESDFLKVLDVLLDHMSQNYIIAKVKPGRQLYVEADEILPPRE